MNYYEGQSPKQGGLQLHPFANGEAIDQAPQIAKAVNLAYVIGAQEQRAHNPEEVNRAIPPGNLVIAAEIAEPDQIGDVLDGEFRGDALTGVAILASMLPLGEKPWHRYTNCKHLGPRVAQATNALPLAVVWKPSAEYAQDHIRTAGAVFSPNADADFLRQYGHTTITDSRGQTFSTFFGIRQDPLFANLGDNSTIPADSVIVINPDEGKKGGYVQIPKAMIQALVTVPPANKSQRDLMKELRRAMHQRFQGSTAEMPLLLMIEHIQR